MTETTPQYFSFRNGQPSEPDVTLLLKKWPELRIGDRMPYTEITEVLGLAPKSRRWRTITSAWRLRLRGSGLILECDPGKAFYVASADQISAKTYTVITHVSRTARKQRHALLTTEQHPNLPDEVRWRCQHQGRLMYAIEKDARAARKGLFPDTRRDEPVRIEPPEQHRIEHHHP